MKRIGLGIAIAALSTTGIASAAVLSSQAEVTTSGDHHSAEIAARDTRLAASIDGIGADGLLATAGDAAADVADLVPGVEDITALLPQLPDLAAACGIDLPVGLPVPAGTIAEAANTAEAAAALAAGQLSGVPVPALPVAIDDASLAALKGQLSDCLAAHSGGALPLPSVCAVDGNLPPLPVAVPGEVSDILAAVSADFGNITGHAVSIGSGNSIGVSCAADVAVPGAPALPELPVPAIPEIPSLPDVDVPGLTANVAGTASGAVGTAAGTATGAVNAAAGAATGAIDTAAGAATDAIGAAAGAVGSVTGTVDGLTGTVAGTAGSVTGLVDGVLATPVPAASCDADVSGGLSGILGGLTARISGTC